MKSEFVSNVTHELKTPLSVIQLIAETLSSGRYGSPARVPHYAKLLDTETQKFTRLIDNILAYARLSESDVKYSVAPAHANDLVDEALDGFQVLLAQREFLVEVAVPDDLPVVLVDRRAVLQAIENVVDNAIKYSVDRRELRVQGCRSDHSLVIAVSDRGVGISEDEIDRVCDKFFRGCGVKNGGSGLGLAITRQIVEAHGGRLSIHSTVGYGTRVELSLPLTQA
jgi:signal transduction histidine kinase